MIHSAKLPNWAQAGRVWQQRGRLAMLPGSLVLPGPADMTPSATGLLHGNHFRVRREIQVESLLQDVQRWYRQDPQTWRPQRK